MHADESDSECTPPSESSPNRCKRRPPLRAFFIAPSKAGFEKSSPFWIINSIRVLSICTIRPAPMFRCPTSLLPICPSGRPDRGTAGLNQRVGIFPQQAVVHWFAGQSDGIGFGFCTISPAIKDDKDERFWTSHKLVLGFRLLGCDQCWIRNDHSSERQEVGLAVCSSSSALPTSSECAPPVAA